MSYTRRVMRPEEVVAPGDEIMVMVKEIDPDRKRISLSIKEAEGDPWADIEGKINAIDYNNLRLSIDNVTAEKSDGSQYSQPISPSNVIITKLKSDKKRPFRGEIEGE